MPKHDARFAPSFSLLCDYSSVKELQLLAGDFLREEICFVVSFLDSHRMKERAFVYKPVPLHNKLLARGRG
jgi:hypothetical protein